MSILDEEYLINDKSLEFYNTILCKFENHCKRSAISEKIFSDNRDVLIKYLPDVIKIYGDDIIINNNPNTITYNKNRIIWLGLCHFIPQLFLFDLSYIPLLDEKKIKYINNINIYNNDIYKVIRRHNTKHIVQIMVDNNELKEFNPNIIIDEIENLSIPNINAIYHIGDEHNKFFIKRIKELSFNLVDSSLYMDSKNSIIRVCNKYNDLFRYSEIKELKISLSDLYYDLYWNAGKKLIIYDKGLDEYSFNMISNFRNLKADNIKIYIFKSFIDNQTSVENANLNNYISIMFESIMRENNEFKSLNVIFNDI